MRLSPSTGYLQARNAPSRVISVRTYFRKTTDLSSSPSWTDISSYIESPFPEIETSLEYETGLSTSDSIDLVGTPISYFVANMFNATASEWIELKIEIQLGIPGAALASDVVPAFQGIVDKRAEYDERADTVRFSVNTYEDELAKIAGENIVTQYTTRSGDFDDPTYLVFPLIPGLALVTANVTSYVLQVGVHEITYDYNGGSETAALDGGTPVTIGSTNFNLTNREGTQKVTLVGYDMGQLPAALSTGGVLTEKIVVTTAGDVFPKQFYHFVGIRRAISLALAKVGISSIVFDTLQLSSHDSTDRVSWLSNPPENGTDEGSPKFVLGSDGGNSLLYLMVGEKLYKYTLSSRSWTYQNAIESGGIPWRILVSPYTGRVLVVYLLSSTWKVRIFEGTSVLATISPTGLSSPHSVAIAYDDTDDIDHFCLIDAGGQNVRIYDTIDGGVITSFTYAGLGYGGTGAGPVDGHAWVRGNGSQPYYLFPTYEDSPAAYKFHEVRYDRTVPGWTNIGIVNSDVPNYPHEAATYNEAENNIYYVSSGTLSEIRVMAKTGTGGTLLKSNETMVEVRAMTSRSGVSWAVGNGNGKIYKLDGGALTTLTTLETAPALSCQWYAIDAPGDGKLYGLSFGAFWVLSSTIEMSLEVFDGDGISVREMFDRALGSYGLLGTIRANKSAAIYRRGDSSGAPLDSGSTLSLTVSDTVQIEKQELAFDAIDYVKVNNGREEHSFDGTNFDRYYLPGARVLDVTCPWTPTWILKDLAKYLRAFFATSRSLYTIRGGLPFWEYETFDKLSITYTTTKITKTGSGPIYSFRIVPDGSTSVVGLL